ncbi:MAG: GMP/IMP nucleotidase [Methylococcales bacterium]|jgi:5'-nucleotidase|nr:GMP/IMP nucleotidase [Methylococcales bacterium]
MTINFDPSNLKTILLDMDGTLLDLNFDNYFWQEFVPQKYAEKFELTIDQSKEILYEKFGRHEGTMNWYCIDFWTHELKLEIELLKHEIDHLIKIHPHVVDFLNYYSRSPINIVLVTNAHQKSLDLKMKKTQLNHLFDQIICAHEIGIPKEDPLFWEKLKQSVDYEYESTMLVDDSLAVLTSAKKVGIKHLISIIKPDSQRPERKIEEFYSINDFRELMS